MGSIENISELCRLCLVKDQVNVPIFEENATKEQTFVKINSCLPVKVSRDDSLPKKICDGCSCKLDMLYTFRNTSVDSEKQLLKWLNQAGLSCSQSAVKDPLASTKPEVTIKQETFEPTDSRDDLGLDTHSYIMQQQKLPYSQEFEFGEPSESNVGLMTDEPAPKKAKRAAALNKASVETDEDDLDAAMQITKAEDEDSDEIDQPEYVEAPSTSADDQPGPSGVNKTTVEAPSKGTNSLAKGPIQCEVCLKVFPSSRKLGIHKIRHKERKHECPLCEKKFILQGEVKVHISRFHEREYKFFCDFCDYKTYNGSNLQAHVISMHTRDFRLKCDVCGKGFLNKKKLASHKEITHEGERFTCEFCGKAFMVYRNFKLHLQEHDPVRVESKFSCPNCPKCFTKETCLKKHVKTMHSGEGKFVCDVCGKRMRTRYNWISHMKVHSGQKDYVCEVCGKAFSTMVILTNHSRVHTGEKPFQCNICNKKFTQSGSLDNHKKIHSGEKKIVCEVCDKAFTTNSALRTHLRVHTNEKPFKCVRCDRAFAQRSCLTIHMRCHTGERPYKCDLCNKEYIKKSVLKAHNCKGVVVKAEPEPEPEND
ncbi:zinc finger protein ZFP2 isoform X8 [Tribolium castaneum]|uniref:zinc finger protein ZFP2 isoform X8 n=1 Tax=Tribolium castaneum TaxID=7070 RepID=UPI0030FE94B0